MDAIQLIQKDHRLIEELFRRFDRAERDEDRDEQGATARAIVRALSVHAALEEQFVYPVLGRVDGEGVLDALEEHHAAKVTLRELDALGPTSDRFAAKLHVLAANVRQHVEEEERELLPQLERTLDADRLRGLGETLERARAIAPTRPHPAAPDTPPGVFVAGAIAAVYDRLRDALRGAAALVRALAIRGAGSALDGVRGLASETKARGRSVVEVAREEGRRTSEVAREQGRRTAEEVAESGRRITVAAAEPARAARTARVGKRGRKRAEGGRGRSPTGR